MTKLLVAIDDGHGMETPGKRTPPIPELRGRVIRENEANRAIAKYTIEALRRCGFEIVLTAPGDRDASLAERVQAANRARADIFVSHHYNAYDGSFDGANPSGIETYYHTGSVKGKRLVTLIHAELLKSTPQVNRGVKAANFYVLKHTAMPQS